MAIAPSDQRASVSKSAHTSDALLQPFLAPDFDPATYLNRTLAPFKPALLPTLSAETQTLVSQLNVQLARLSDALTALTDEILRSGGRLAYEVEVLRGDALALSDVLSSGLKDDIARFAPAEDQHAHAHASTADAVAPADLSAPAESTPPHPPEIRTLHTLTTAHARLQSVTRLFGAALDWPIPPSELSLKSSFISVSAPEPGSTSALSATASSSREAKGREWAERTRREVVDLLMQGGEGADGDAADGLEKALARIEELRDLAGVWKGTSEEKARLRFVEALVRLVDETRKTVHAGLAGGADRRAQARGPSGRRWG